MKQNIKGVCLRSFRCNLIQCDIKSGSIMMYYRISNLGAECFSSEFFFWICLLFVNWKLKTKSKSVSGARIFIFFALQHLKTEVKLNLISICFPLHSSVPFLPSILYKMLKNLIYFYNFFLLTYCWILCVPGSHWHIWRVSISYTSLIHWLSAQSHVS